tara:strand:+ start:2485 stop:3114 length:630 start_codon:yes stop_codon:yes gene_type:complete
MGGTKSKLRENELVDWRISNDGGFTEPGTLAGYFVDSKYVLTLYGKKVKIDQGETTDDEMKNEYIENEEKIGVFGKNGNLSISDIELDENNNYIFTIKSGMTTYYMNWSRSDNGLFNYWKTFLRYAELNTDGKAHSIIDNLCYRYDCHGVNDSHTYNRNHNRVSMFGGGMENNYNYITNPLSKRKVLVNGNLGKKILNSYINQLNISTP